MTEPEEPTVEPERSWVDDLPEGAGLQPNGKFILPLEKPVQLGEREVNQLTLRPPKGKDYREMPVDLSKADFGVLMTFGGRLAGEIPRVVDELGPADVIRLVEVASGFFAGTPEQIGTSQLGS